MRYANIGTMPTRADLRAIRERAEAAAAERRGCEGLRCAGCSRLFWAPQPALLCPACAPRPVPPVPWEAGRPAAGSEAEDAEWCRLARLGLAPEPVVDRAGVERVQARAREAVRAHRAGGAAARQRPRSTADDPGLPRLSEGELAAYVAGDRRAENAYVAYQHARNAAARSTPEGRERRNRASRESRARARGA